MYTHHVHTPHTTHAHLTHRPGSADTSEDELDDQDIQKIIIVAQTPPASRRPPVGDRTGNFTSRPQMTNELAQVINDGLYFYEQVTGDAPHPPYKDMILIFIYNRTFSLTLMQTKTKQLLKM